MSPTVVDVCIPLSSFRGLFLHPETEHTQYRFARGVMGAWQDVPESSTVERWAHVAFVDESHNAHVSGHNDFGQLVQSVVGRHFVFCSLAGANWGLKCLSVPMRRLLSHLGLFF